MEIDGFIIWYIYTYWDDILYDFNGIVDIDFLYLCDDFVNVEMTLQERYLLSIIFQLYIGH